jgi:nitrate reductase assembly molybdenum cofactor insertion protein NarJ
MKDLTHYKLLAEMFRYPTDDLRTFTGKWREIIHLFDPELLSKLDPFILHIHEKPLASQQEYYTGTFDVQAICFLDIGYVLFGEDYKRGVFLVNIKKEQLATCNDCGCELPDHLPNMLTLLPKIKDPALAEELIYSLLIPAIHEMIRKFNDMNNVYKGLLEILVTIMETDCPDGPYERFDFGRRKARYLAGTFHNEMDNTDEFKL